jgi:hypothetical protein
MPHDDYEDFGGEANICWPEDWVQDWVQDLPQDWKDWKEGKLKRVYEPNSTRGEARRSSPRLLTSFRPKVPAVLTALRV